MKKLVALALVSLVFVSLLGSYVRAEEIGVVPFYDYTEDLYVKLSIDSKGKATCAGEVVPKKATYSCSISVKLQKKNGSSWTTLSTWTGSGEGYAGASASGTRQVSSGNTYRVYVSATVRDASGKVVETPTKASSEKAF